MMLSQTKLLLRIVRGGPKHGPFTASGSGSFARRLFVVSRTQGMEMYLPSRETKVRGTAMPLMWLPTAKMWWSFGRWMDLPSVRERESYPVPFPAMLVPSSSSGSTAGWNISFAGPPRKGSKMFECAVVSNPSPRMKVSSTIPPAEGQSGAPPTSHLSTSRT